MKRPIGFYRFSQCPRMAAGLLALAFLSPIAACSSKGSLDDLKNPTPSRSTSSFKPSTSASIASDTPTWNFPVNLDGWRMDIIDRDGKNRAINSAGCYLTTSQRPIAGPLEGDREESEYQNERIATTLRSQLTNVQAQPASETRVSGFSGKKIEGAASEISYGQRRGGIQGLVLVARVRQDQDPRAPSVNLRLPGAGILCGGADVHHQREAFHIVEGLGGLRRLIGNRQLEG